MIEFHVPTRPFTPIDALNRRAAATGSPRYAMATSLADYNGHHVRVWWNDYRRYYITEYFWAGRVVLCRGSFADCLHAAIREYDRGALGASVGAFPRDDDADAIACARCHSRLIEGKEAMLSWSTWRHQCAAESARDVANPGAQVRVFDWDLMQQAASQDEYERAVKAKHGRVWI